MCTIQCLRAGCTYRVRARARNASGYSSYSGASDAQTAPDRPLAPEPPVAAARSASSISVTWAPPQHDGGSAISAYRLELCRGDSTRTILHAYGSTRCTCLHQVCLQGMTKASEFNSSAAGSYRGLQVACLHIRDCIAELPCQGCGRQCMYLFCRCPTDRCQRCKAGAAPV